MEDVEAVYFKNIVIDLSNNLIKEVRGQVSNQLLDSSSDVGQLILTDNPFVCNCDTITPFILLVECNTEYGEMRKD